MGERGVVAAWCRVRGATGRWVLMVLAAWGVLTVFARISIPLKYPFEARGQVLDSGVVVGLLLPLIVMSTVLDDGPRDLVVPAARSLFAMRAGLGVAYTAVAVTGAALTGILADLPRALVLTDAALGSALVLAGVAAAGSRIGWLPAVVLTLLVSAHGLVPWELNVVYHREVGVKFGALTVGVLAAALVGFATGGAAYRPRRRPLLRRRRMACKKHVVHEKRR